MKAMLLAFVALAVIAVAADYGLDAYAGFSSADRGSAPGVRLD